MISNGEKLSENGSMMIERTLYFLSASMSCSNAHEGHLFPQKVELLFDEFDSCT
jgi:hypothetical protein